MGYFPNGTSHLGYDAVVCSKCHFQPGEAHFECQIMEIHALYNYDQFREDQRAKDLRAILDHLIPRREDGHNDLCNFFIEKQRHNKEEMF